jgi:hypothetical protein
MGRLINAELAGLVWQITLPTQSRSFEVATHAWVVRRLCEGW